MFTDQSTPKHIAMKKDNTDLKTTVWYSSGRQRKQFGMPFGMEVRENTCIIN